jgi:hypothetical protein
MSSRRSKSAKSYDEEDDTDEERDSPDKKKEVKKRKPAKVEDDNEDYDNVVQKKQKGASGRRDDDDDDDEDEDGDDGDDDGEEDLSELETGQVMRVYVQDFMCHNKLTVEFGRHVNFVTGSNGSGNKGFNQNFIIFRFVKVLINIFHWINFVGKSAIVAALQLCLRASASNTGRGTKLDGLIREGSDGPAIMRVTLLNEGPDAYKPNDYGNRIIVERKIAKGSGGGYKLLAKNGQVKLQFVICSFIMHALFMSRTILENK